MKRSSLPFLFAALIAVGLVFSAQQDPSVRGDDFEKKLRAAATGQHFAMVSDETVSQEEVSVPLTVRWHPRRWGPGNASQTAIAFPDSTQRFGFVRGRAARVDCFVRYLDGRAQVVEIRAAHDAAEAAADLRTALMQEFPALPIKLRTQ
jgi:hypothetical protein